MNLDEKYQQIIDEQRTHLLKIQKDFNDLCELEKKRAQSKLAEIPKEDREGRQQILAEQKAVLDEALSKLKAAVGESTRKTMHALEDIIRTKESKIIEDLEKQIDSL